MSGWVLIELRESVSSTADAKAALAVLIALYPSPASNKYVMKSNISTTDAEMGSMLFCNAYACHLRKYTLYCLAVPVLHDPIIIC